MNRNWKIWQNVWELTFNVITEWKKYSIYHLHIVGAIWFNCIQFYKILSLFSMRFYEIMQIQTDVEFWTYKIKKVFRVCLSSSYEVTQYVHPSVHSSCLAALQWITRCIFKFANVKDLRLSLNLLNLTGYVMHQQFNIQQLYVLPTLYLCVLYLSENKQRFVPLTS